MSSSGVPEPTFSGAGAGDSCATLFINTTLASPDPDVVEHLNEGDLLEIEAVTSDGPVQAVTQDGQVAGNLASTRLLTLLHCLNTGTRYVAKVTAVNGGEINILVQPWS